MSSKVPTPKTTHDVQVEIVDNYSEDLQAFLQRQLHRAQELNICTGYLSKHGLEYLEQWIQVMEPKAQVRLLIGMPPMGNWRYPKPNQKAAHTFLSMHLDKDDDWMCKQVSRLYESYQLKIRLQLQAPSIHAKLYHWTADNGQVHVLVGSSNLTQSGTATSRELNLHLAGPANILHWFPKYWDAAFPYVPNHRYSRPTKESNKTQLKSSTPRQRRLTNLARLKRAARTGRLRD